MTRYNIDELTDALTRALWRDRCGDYMTPPDDTFLAYARDRTRPLVEAILADMERQDQRAVEAAEAARRSSWRRYGKEKP